MKIGKLFHLTPFVDDLEAALRFFNNVFSPLCVYHDYATHWHRNAAILTIADTVIEPMQPLPPAEGKTGTSWFRYLDKFGPRVHNIAFYVEGWQELAQRLTDAGVAFTDGGVPGNVFTYPKSTAPMLEFYEPQHHRTTDPRLSEHWRALRDDFWPNHQPMTILRLSHITVVVADRAAATRFYREVLDAVELPAQASSVPGAESTFVLLGEDTILELAQPTGPACPIRADLDDVGECVTGAVFTVRDLESAVQRLSLSERMPPWTRSGNRLDFDRKATWNCQYTLTEAVLVGDPRLA